MKIQGEITTQTVQKLQFLHRSSFPRLNFLLVVSFLEYWGMFQSCFLLLINNMKRTKYLTFKCCSWYKGYRKYITNAKKALDHDGLE
jgi:hypothetical protein